jgi:hypothetical protein
MTARTALVRVTALAPAPTTRPALVADRMAPVARMVPVALAGRVAAARLRVAPAALARIRLIVVLAGAWVRFPVTGVAVVAAVRAGRLAARAVTAGRRAWPLTTRRLVTGRPAGLPGPASVPPRRPPARITPGRPAVPALRTRPRTLPQTRPGQTRPGQTRPGQIPPVQIPPVLGRLVKARLAQVCPAPGCPVLIQ